MTAGSPHITLVAPSPRGMLLLMRLDFTSAATVVLGLLLPLLVGAGAELVLEVPSDVKVTSASAIAPQLKLEASGLVSGSKIIFSNLLPATAYDIRLNCADGRVIQGVDMSWYSDEPLQGELKAMDDDD